jgi:hypothetical protein
VNLVAHTTVVVPNTVAGQFPVTLTFGKGAVLVVQALDAITSIPVEHVRVWLRCGPASHGWLGPGETREWYPDDLKLAGEDGTVVFPGLWPGREYELEFIRPTEVGGRSVEVSHRVWVGYPGENRIEVRLPQGEPEDEFTTYEDYVCEEPVLE